MSKITLKNQAADPPAPSAGEVTLFSRTGDKRVHSIDELGVVSQVGATAASESAAGIAEIATQAEVDAGTDDLRIVTPLKLATTVFNRNPVGVDMSAGGRFEVVSNLGSANMRAATTLLTFAARRNVPGTSGTTTIQLELNGVPIAGAVLSWLFSEAAWTRKFTAISQAVLKGDRISFRVTSVEAGEPEDIIAEAYA